MPAGTGSTPKTTPAERKALAAQKKVAAQIAKLRKQGVAWDGANGIVARKLCNGAPQGRALLRKFGLVQQAGGIAKSYERTDSFRAAESARRQPAKAKATPKKTGAKPRPKKTNRATRVA